MSDFNNYFEFAFNHTLVNKYLTKNIYAITNQGKVYYDDGNGLRMFADEEKALQHLLKTLDLSEHYRFFDVFYDTLRSADGKLKYKSYVCLIARKTNKTKNHIMHFLCNPNSGVYNDGKLIPDEEFTRENGINKDTPFNSVSKDLTHICGMELDPIIQSKLEIDDKIYYDLRDNFIVDEILPEPKNENKITCNILFNHIKTANQLSVDAINKITTTPEIALIDISGSYIKTTGFFNDEPKIVIDDSLDIYREFIGGTTKTLEEMEQQTNTNDDIIINNDDNYI